LFFFSVLGPLLIKLSILLEYRLTLDRHTLAPTRISASDQAVYNHTPSL
jgi:hypothetical protein